MRICATYARTKKDSYPLPRIQEALESMAGARIFPLWISRAVFGKSVWPRITTVHRLYGRQPRILRIHENAFRAM